MPEVRRTIALPFGHGELNLGDRRRFAGKLPRYDRAILLPNSLKSALVPWFAGIPVRTGWRGRCANGLLNDLRTLDEQALPLIVERFAALAQPAGEASSARFPNPGWRSMPPGAPRRWPSSPSTRLRRCSPSRPGPSTGPPSAGPRDTSPKWHGPTRRADTRRGSSAPRRTPPSRGDRSPFGVPVADLASRTSLDEAIDSCRSPPAW